MKVSVVVPAFNEEKLLGRSLARMRAAMEAFTTRGWGTELIVCDNNSTDATARIAAEAGATVVFEPVNQIGRARNRGAAAATGDWLVFVDADSFPTLELFTDVAEQMASGSCLAGGVIVRLEGNHRLASWITRGWNLISRVGKLMAGSFIFCEAAAFRQVGGFDEKFYVSEEIHLSNQLRRLARASHKRIVILRRHPLLTSARKLHLYSKAEHLRFLWRLARSPFRTQTNRSACPLWYDGRR